MLQFGFFVVVISVLVALFYFSEYKDTTLF